MNTFERRLKSKIETWAEDDLKSITPSLQLRAYSQGRLKGELYLGKTYRFYDLASLTKIIFTLPLVMREVEKGNITTSNPMIDYLPWFPSRKTKLKDLLCHSAGLPWWAPFYSQLKGSLNPNSRWRQLESQLRQIRISRSKRTIYSDVDFFMLGMMLEHQMEHSLENIWRKYLESLKLDELTLHFNPYNRPTFPRWSYAPTESCSWRKKIIQGEVHDENCWALGGVAPHAGLFGSLEDLSRWGLLLRKSWLKKKGSALIGQSTLQKFARRALPLSKGDWALGFMLPTRGSASCGKYFSRRSFGHTGFTGTSLWFDPNKDILVLILANRVHPTRENSRFLALRPHIHNSIVELL